MIIYDKLFLHIGEVYDEESSPGARVDIVRYRERFEPLWNCHWEPFHTLWIDLNQPADALFGAIKKDTRHEIRVAGDRDRLVARNFADAGSLEEFCKFYDGFAASKGLRSVNRDKLSALKAAGRLWLSCATDPTETALVWHAYILQCGRARLLHSASLHRKSDAANYRQALGRANRFLHWRDMLALQQGDVPILDLGGWYAGSSDQQKLRINRFKTEFGGVLVTTFNCDQARTMRGRVVLGAWRWLHRREQ